MSYHFAIFTFMNASDLYNASQGPYGQPGHYNSLLNRDDAEIVNVCSIPCQDMGKDGLRILITYRVTDQPSAAEVNARYGVATDPSIPTGFRYDIKSAYPPEFRPPEFRHAGMYFCRVHGFTADPATDRESGGHSHRDCKHDPVYRLAQFHDG